MEPSSKKRVIFRIELTPDAKQKLVNISHGFGMKQCTVMERLLEWFARQERSIQCIVLGFYAAAVDQHVARFLLRRDRKTEVA